MVFTSRDYGLTFSGNLSEGRKDWADVTMDGTGQKIAATVTNGAYLGVACVYGREGVREIISMGEAHHAAPMHNLF